MSRGGGGRGRGRGGSKPFSREVATGLGIGSNDAVPGPVSQPPPLFEILDHKPIPINITNAVEYQLMLKQDFVESIRDSPAHISMAVNSNVPSRGSHQLQELIRAIPPPKNNFDWSMFPVELRPKLHASRLKNANRAKAKVKTEVDIVQHLNNLEKMESTTQINTKIKQEIGDVDNDDDILEEDEEDEEMDDGTDYANNYFDNGEAYEDEDDNLEDGPIY